MRSRSGSIRHHEVRGVVPVSTHLCMEVVVVTIRCGRTHQDPCTPLGHSSNNVWCVIHLLLKSVTYSLCNTKVGNTSRTVHPDKLSPKNFVVRVLAQSVRFLIVWMWGRFSSNSSAFTATISMLISGHYLIVSA